MENLKSMLVGVFIALIGVFLALIIVFGIFCKEDIKQQAKEVKATELRMQMEIAKIQEQLDRIEAKCNRVNCTMIIPK